MNSLDSQILELVQAGEEFDPSDEYLGDLGATKSQIRRRRARRRKKRQAAQVIPPSKKGTPTPVPPIKPPTPPTPGPTVPWTPPTPGNPNVAKRIKFVASQRKKCAQIAAQMAATKNPKKWAWLNGQLKKCNRVTVKLSGKIPQKYAPPTVKAPPPPPTPPGPGPGIPDNPLLDELLKKQKALEKLLKMGGRGKTKIKLKIGKLQTVMGDLLGKKARKFEGDWIKAAGKSAAGGAGSMLHRGAHAEPGSVISHVRAGDDMEDVRVPSRPAVAFPGAALGISRGKSRMLWPDSVGAFGGSPIITAPESFGQDPYMMPNDLISQGILDPSLYGDYDDAGYYDDGYYDDGYYDDPYAYELHGESSVMGPDPYGLYADPDSMSLDQYAFEDLTELFEGGTGYDQSVILGPLPEGHDVTTPLDLQEYMGPTGYADSVPWSLAQEDYQFEPLDLSFAEELFSSPGSSGGDRYAAGAPSTEEDLYGSGSFDWQLPADWFDPGTNDFEGGVYDSPELYDDTFAEPWEPASWEEEYSYGPSVVDTPEALSEQDAEEALMLMDEQLSDAETIMERDLIPRYKSLCEQAARTGDPHLHARAAAGAGVLKEYRQAREQLADGLQIAQEDGVSGAGLIALARGLGGVPGIALTAGVLGMSLLVGSGAGKAMTTVGEGVKTALLIVAPIIGILVGAKLSGVKIGTLLK